MAIFAGLGDTDFPSFVHTGNAEHLIIPVWHYLAELLIFCHQSREILYTSIDYRMVRVNHLVPQVQFVACSTRHSRPRSRKSRRRNTCRRIYMGRKQTVAILQYIDIINKRTHTRIQFYPHDTGCGSACEIE